MTPRKLPPPVKAAARKLRIPHKAIIRYEYEWDVSRLFYVVGLYRDGMPPVRVVIPATAVTFATTKEKSDGRA